MRVGEWGGGWEINRECHVIGFAHMYEYEPTSSWSMSL
jgi:hypothetical protein